MDALTTVIVYTHPFNLGRPVSHGSSIAQSHVVPDFTRLFLMMHLFGTMEWLLWLLGYFAAFSSKTIF
jgi:hypothetical protein